MISQLRSLRDTSTPQRLLRLVVGLGPVVALLALVPAGHTPPPWVVVVVVLLGLVSAVLPDSQAATLADLAVVGWWLLRIEGAVPVWSLLAAVAMAAGHVAGVLVSYGPARVDPDPALVRLWAVRGAWLLVPAVVVFGLDRALDGTPSVSVLWPSTLVVVVVAALTVSFVLRPRE